MISARIDEPCNSFLFRGPPKSNEMIALPADFEPNSYSIICGRGSSCYKAVGNRRFRVIVTMFLEQYSLADTKLAKSNIVSQVMDMIHSSGGSFVKQQQQKGEGGQWYQVSTADAREKVGAQFRDCLHEQYRSAAKSKLAQRRRRRAEQRSNNFFNGNNSWSSVDSSATTATTLSYSECCSAGDHGEFAQEETNDHHCWEDETLTVSETFTVSPDIFEAGVDHFSCSV
jgi:hypothetical protein